jgi:glyoxylase-like metal-dependent hydrolase (beta-lactamase superfamily II)
MRTRHGLIAIVLAALAAAPALAQAPVREITKISGDLYRFRNNGHYSVFLVTPAGVIATDPIDRDAATFLKTEIAQRFKVPVKYVVYSHGHGDHGSGGEVFSDTATFVGHDLAKMMMVTDKVPTPLPQETFTETKTISLGGATVELSYLGPNHGDGMIVMHFPKERALFVVDIVPIDSLAYRDFPNADINGWIDSLKKIEQMDFDVLAPGHGPIGTRDHARKHREYLEDLQAQVTEHVTRGMSLVETKDAVDLTKYKTWASYDSRDLNIEGMFRMLGGR